MTEIAEAIAIDVVSQNKEDPCWFCEEVHAEPLKNDEQEDPGTEDSVDAHPENDEDNNASKLGTNLGSRPTWQIEHPKEPGKQTEIVPAAHHCIPGNASLAKATALHKFMREGGPLNLANDIGYDVNSRENGVWLPGNYAVREGNAEFGSKKWSTFQAGFKNGYAIRAMATARAQFHDAHTKYNKKVLKTLESVAAKLESTDDKCNICGEKYDKTRPPLGLVRRLHHVSGEHRRMLEDLSDGGKRHVDAGYYTSSRVKAYYDPAQKDEALKKGSVL